LKQEQKVIVSKEKTLDAKIKKKKVTVVDEKENAFENEDQSSVVP